MTAKKPRTALANLLDQLKDVNAVAGADVVAATALKEQQQTVAKAEEKTYPSHIQLSYLEPNDCRPWRFADRPEEEMGDIAELARSLKEVGQQEPILVRPVTEGDIKYEIVFGNRRWRACLQNQQQILAIIKPVADQEAALYQKEENENRKDLSDLARARSYQAQISAGIFNSEAELGKGLGINLQSLNDIMAFVRIPAELVEAIPQFNKVSRKTAVKLAALAKQKKTFNVLLQLAPQIGTKKITAANMDAAVNRVLLPQTAKTSSLTQDVIVNDKHGKRLFTLKTHDSGSVTIRINKHLYGHYDHRALKDIVFDHLIKT